VDLTARVVDTRDVSFAKLFDIDTIAKSEHSPALCLGLGAAYQKQPRNQASEHRVLDCGREG
jgi:hypothetical protein